MVEAGGTATRPSRPLGRRVAAALVAVLAQDDPTAVPDVIRKDPALLAEPAFLDAAEHHRITPALFVSLQHHPAVPDAVLGQLSRGHHDQVFRHTAVLANVEMLGRTLDGMGCSWAVIKGPHLACYVHPRPDLRTYVDLDVVVDHRRLPDVVAALEAQGNEVLDRNWTLIRDGERAQVSLLLRMDIPLDLHWHLLNRGPVRHAFHLDMDSVLARTCTQALGPVTANVLSDEDALVHLSLYTSLAGASRLVWIYDVHALLTRHDLDPDLIVERASEAGAGLCMAVVLQRAQATFGTTLPAGLLERLAAPWGWRAATRALDRLRPVESGYGRVYMGRTLIRATRVDTRSSIHEFRRTAVANTRRSLPHLSTGAFEERTGPNPLHEVGGDLRDRDELFASIARATEPVPDAPGTTVTVMMLPAPDPAASNPYLHLLVGALGEQGVQMRPFGLRGVLTGSAQLVHVHWPEASLGVQRPSLAVRRVSRLLTTLATARLRGQPVIWTSHNLRSHERPHPRLEAFFWRSFPHLVSGWLSLSSAGVQEVRKALPVLRERPVWVTRHGHYRDYYQIPPEVGDGPAGIDPAPGGSGTVIVHVGQIRAYKNVPALVRAFSSSELAARLVVAGSCHPAGLKTEIIAAAGTDTRVDLRLERADDAALARLLVRADLVVLPYSETFNSGTALLALSFDRPVLLPRTPVYEELQRDTGPAWVHLFDGDIRAEVLATALADVEATAADRTGRALGPDYDWAPIARATVSAYRALLA